jgi:poly-gamma-glutamate capsule biosynthesis protein CapA/YwtB (metallophosphatase superfamily)
MASSHESPAVRLVAVGDLLLAADPGRPASRDPRAIFDGVRPLLAEAGVAFANLECTLPGDGGTVPTEPRVVATVDLVRAAGAAGFSVVSLANNHTFDCLDEGFHNLRRLLDEMGIAYFGAGDNLAEAMAPAILEMCGIRLAFLGAADERSGVSRFAGPKEAGVARLDVAAMADQIRRLRREVDHVIVSLHWGEERLLIPAPAQIEQAHALAEAGASLVLGHHPHVIQGMEKYRNVPVIYSLGNFVACDVPFTDGDRLTWNRTERAGCVLQAEVGKAEVRDVRLVATYDNGRSVSVDGSGFGDRRIAKASRALARGVTPGRYRREYFWIKTGRPILQHLRWSSLKRLRPGKVVHFLKNAVRGWRAG